MGTAPPEPGASATDGIPVTDWRRMLAATGDARGGPRNRGLSDSAVVDSWLDEGDEGAFTSIVTHVGVASTDEVDRLDAALLSLAVTDLRAQARRRLIKFYAIFKIAEMQRYHEFRGFPCDPAQ